MKLEPLPIRTYNPRADLIPTHLSISKMHDWRLNQADKRQGRYPLHIKQRSAEATRKTASKKWKPIILQHPDGQIVKYESRGDACVKLGYKSPVGSPIMTAIRRTGIRQADGTMKVTLLGNKYIILEM